MLMKSYNILTSFSLPGSAVGPLLTLLAALLTSTACSSGDSESAQADSDTTAPEADSADSANPQADSSAGGVTYHGAARAALERNCTSCHTDGGIGPFALDTFESAAAFAGASVSAINAGRMPPWSPDPDCRSYQGERVMSTADTETLVAWLEAGTPEGDPASYVAPDLPTSVAATRAADLVLAPELPFQPDSESPDDYHCFVMPQEFDEETWIHSVLVTPGNGDTVHHVLVYRVAASESATIAGLDAADPREGYTCFGGTGTGLPQTIAGWVPGAQPAVLPEQTAYRVLPGDKIVMQVHYNLANSNAPDPGTTVSLWLLEEQPAYLIDSVPVANLSIEIDSGDPQSIQTTTWWPTGQTAVEILGIAPHMHLLGRSASARLTRSDGSEECLVDVPDWDFNWQQSFMFHPGESLIVTPEDEIHVECIYDNSASNQPVVNGQQLEPTDVVWGEGTYDEMCVQYLIVREPYAPPVDYTTTCGEFTQCYQTCRAAGGIVMSCTATCVGQGTVPYLCTECMMSSLASCTLPTCPTDLGHMLDCARACQRAEDPTECLTSQCTSQILAFEGCVQPLADPGDCDSFVTSCGASIAYP